MKILSMPAAPSVYVPDYIFKEGTIMVPITNYAYKQYGDSGNTYTGTVTINGQYLRLNTQSGGNTGYTSFITDEIDFTHVNSITLYRYSSSSVTNAHMFTINNVQNDYVPTTPSVEISQNLTTYTLDTSAITGKHRFVLKFYRNQNSAGRIDFGTIAINKA